MLASIVRVDGDDSVYCSVFYAHVTRGVLGASAVIALDMNCTITTATFRTIALS